MTEHVDNAELIAFLDGELDAGREATVSQHMQECASCMAHFDAYTDFEAAFASATPLPAALSDRLRAATRATLAAANRPRRRVLPWLAAAAGLALASALWFVGGAPLEVTVHRDTPPGVLRGAGDDRLHLEVTLRAAGFVALFARTAAGGIERLLPHPDPVLGDLAVEQPLSAGTAVRVPGAALFDFAASGGTSFVELDLLVGDARFDETELARIEREIASTPSGLPAALRATYARSRTIPLQ